MNKELTARVIARNRANEVANQIYDQVVGIFRYRIGQQVCKVDGTFLQKIAKLIPKWEFPDDKYPGPTVMVYRYTSDYSVCFVVKTCQQVKDTSHCHYEECSVYICDLKDGKVVGDKLYDQPNNRTDFTVAEIEKLREIFKKKQREFSVARSNLFPFGESD